MRRLILMRHAKSSWDDPSQDDRDRPLNSRGRLAAVLMGAWLAEKDLLPDHGLLSPARRVLDTWERVQFGGGGDADATTHKPLYVADPTDALEVLRTAPKKAETVLMLGHEPGTSAFLRRMCDGDARAGFARAFEKFPTAAIAVLELPDQPWAKAEFGSGLFLEYVAPKDLV